MTNIYFIKGKDAIKIGRSNDVQKRLLELQTGNSETLEILYIIENVEETFETYLHNVAKRFNIKGEWFKEDVIKHLLNHPWYQEHMKKPSKE